ncbi:MAG: site-specific DNA-methyltransferase [Kiritimatiellae bacterium]|nr:site-specific DNA-methyltransferase [Kiritimatiellia bacterium]
MGRRNDQQKLWKTSPPGSVFHHAGGDVVCADALSCLNALRDCCADILFLDPPFNLGKPYGKNGSHGDKKKETEYLAYMQKIICRGVDILKPGGALFLYHIPKWAIRISPFLEQFLVFRHWIAISMKNGFVRGNHLYPAHYALLYYTKGKPGMFRRPKVPRPICSKCKKDLRDYGGYKQYVVNGINLSDIWDDLSPVRHRRFKTRAANEMPLMIPQRAVQISGIKGGILVDPFAGSGTSAVAAIAADMHFVVCDRERTYCNLIRRRLNASVSEK